MDDQAKTFLFALLNTPSPTGFELPGQRVWADYVRPYADAVEIDTYGTTWATRRGTAEGEGAPRVMLEAHADEIGFIVKYISDEGFLYIDRIGGSDWVTARGKRVRIQGAKGVVTGVIGNTAIHLRDRKEEKVPEQHELFVDIGASSAEEVAERGVRVGHPMVYADAVEEFAPDLLCGRALDNRIGGLIIAEALRRLAEGAPTPATVYAVNAVQEEIGGHGAAMIAYRLRPTVALVVDVTHATDSPGIPNPKHGAVKLRRGPTVTHGTANHPRVVERLLDVAAAAEIPIQHESSSRYSGTDTDKIFNSRSGIPSALVSLPMRYMHSTVETVHLDDVERVIALMTAFVRALSADDVFAHSLG